MGMQPIMSSRTMKNQPPEMMFQNNFSDFERISQHDMGCGPCIQTSEQSTDVVNLIARVNSSCNTAGVVTHEQNTGTHVPMAESSTQVFKEVRDSSCGG